MTRSRILLLVLALALAAPAGADAAKPQRHLVSLGDSYATGYQATAVGEGRDTRTSLPRPAAPTGAYGPLEETTTLEPYGVIPVPVAKACELSYTCEFRDIHARTIGYTLIAELIVKTLPVRTDSR